MFGDLDLISKISFKDKLIWLGGHSFPLKTLFYSNSLSYFSSELLDVGYIEENLDDCEE